MWYRDPRDVILQELLVAGLETSGDDMQNLVWDCVITPGLMFEKACAGRA